MNQPDVPPLGYDPMGCWCQTMKIYALPWDARQAVAPQKFPNHCWVWVVFNGPALCIYNIQIIILIDGVYMIFCIFGLGFDDVQRPPMIPVPLESVEVLQIDPLKGSSKKVWGLSLLGRSWLCFVRCRTYIPRVEIQCQGWFLCIMLNFKGVIDMFKRNITLAEL